MGGVSKHTKVIALRLPNEVVETLARRAKNNNVSIHEYLRDRVVYDTLRKHIRGKEIEDATRPF